MKKVGKYDEQIRKMFEEGRTYREMAITLGVDEHNLRKRCVAIGCEYERQDSKHPIERINEAGAFEYVDGYVNGDSTIRIKCLTCGSIESLSMVHARHEGYRPKCRTCAAREREKKKRKLQAERAEEKRLKNLSRKKFKQITMRQCANCGALFVGGTKYCSTRCMHRANEERKEINRRVRIKERLVDKDITLEKLFARDNGTCYLCGGLCEWDDCIRADDYFIAGEKYPSIDHVVPLARGGEHSWNNVRLAHFKCNSIKRDHPSVIFSA